MKIYLYDRDNFEFKGSREAQLDVLESEKAGKDIFLIPPQSTTVEINMPKEGYTQVWNGEVWEYVEDHRNEMALTKRGFLPIDYIGKIKDGVIPTPDELEKIKNRELFLENGKLVPMSKERKAREVRYLRNDLLAETDIEMLVDNWDKKSPEDKINWTNYRKYLRDLPLNERFPYLDIMTFVEYIAQNQELQHLENQEE